MATSDDQDLSEEIEENAQGPQSVTGDSGSVRQHSLKDQIEADKYLRAKASQNTTGLGIKLFRCQPPGI